MFNEAVMNLSEEHFIGKGIDKKCYFHPLDESKCIKFLHRQEKCAQKQYYRELYYYEVLRKKGVNTDVFPKYYGQVSTNMGDGYIVELMRNYDGSVCASLDDYLLSDKLLIEHYDWFLQELVNLKKRMLRDKTITMNITPNNVLFKKTSKEKGEFVIIDELGSSVLIPLEYYIDFIANNRIKRKWSYFVSRLKKRYSSDLVLKFVDDLQAATVD